MSYQQFKADGGKSNPLLLDHGVPLALLAVNRVLDYGAKKYEAHSWKGVDTARYNAAARRHQRGRDLGEDFDVESGMLHLAHEATNILFQLQMYIEKHPEIDVFSFNVPPTGHKDSAAASDPFDSFGDRS